MLIDLTKSLDGSISGKDAEALVVFQEAFSKGKTARAQAQVGLAQQALGSWIEAETNLKDALAKKDPWIDKNRSALATALKEVQARLGTVELIGGAPGAKISVNGEPAGVMPLEKPLRVVA